MDQTRFLFGYEIKDEKGKVRTSPGYLDMADGGTLFVRGADQLTAVTQQKLLDALKTGAYCPVGSNRVVKVDFRLLCTAELDPSRFSPDRHPLLHDLLGNALILPPLRDHRDQIPALARHFCKICGACAKNCPYDAIKLNLRLPGHELWEVRHVRTGTGFLVLGLIGGLLSDMLTRTPLYDRITTSVSASAMLNYTMVYLGIIVGVNLLTVLAAALSHRVYRERFLENYSRFALALLPLTCMGVLAFHTHYFLNLGAQLPTLLSQYFSINAVQGLTMEVPREPTLSVQQILIGVGLLWTLITMYLLGRLSPRGRYPRRLGIVPHAVVALILTGVLISVIQQATK